MPSSTLQSRPTRQDSCIECNTRKGDRAAPDFLRTLYRLGCLTPAELDARLRVLKELAAGNLRPSSFRS